MAETILSIESSTKKCSIAISSGEEMLSLCEETFEQYEHGEKLHLFIQWALEGAELKASDLNAIAISAGPGSYTGLRIGVAAAKGICFALDKPLIALDTLMVLASPYFSKEIDFIVPMLDARRMEVYTAAFSPKGERILETHSKILDENSFEEWKDNSLLFIGNGATKFEEITTNPNWQFINELPSAKEMMPLALEKYRKEKFEDLAYFEPYYLKDFIAGKPKAKF